MSTLFVPSTALVSRETILERKKVFFDLLLRWNKAYNLIQRDTEKDIEARHWSDSKRILSFLNQPDVKILDIGSGAGFPGIVLAIYGFHVTLTDIVEKKIFFLEEVIRACNLSKNASVTRDAFSVISAYDYVVSRAFSSLSTILTIQKNVSRETTVGLYLKGESFREEIDLAKKEFSFDCVVHPGKASSSGVVLEIKNLQK